jgi:hypothetical protein
MDAPTPCGQAALPQPLAPKPTAAPGFRAALLLFLLAPAMAELLSGSSPPAEFFTPLTLLVQYLSYGALAVLLREFAVRRGLGWWARLPLALTMGMLIEGVLCKTFFSLHWGDFSFPTGYGRLWGVNWVWTLSLLTYHAGMSFLLPWLAVELACPALRSQPALTHRSTFWLCAGVLAAALFGNLCFPQTPNGHDVYRPGLLASLLSWGGLLYLPWLAARFGPRLDALRAPAPALPALLRPAGLAWLTALAWVAFFAGPAVATTKDTVRLPAPVPLALTLLLAGLALAVAHLLRGVFSPQHACAVLLGTAWFWFVFDILQQASNAQRPDNTSGMGLVGAAGLAGAYWLALLLKRRASQPTAVNMTTEVLCGQTVDNTSDAAPLSAKA